MATRAELFRYQAERAGPKLPKTPPRRRRDAAVDTALPGVSASDRRSTKGHPSASAAKKAAYELEAGGSRKSTRGSANRTKTDAQMRVKRRMAESRPTQER